MTSKAELMAYSVSWLEIVASVQVFFFFDHNLILKVTNDEAKEVLTNLSEQLKEVLLDQLGCLDHAPNHLLQQRKQ